MKSITIVSVIFTIYELLRVVAILLQPAVPESSKRILDRIGVDEHSRRIENAESSFSSSSELIGKELGTDIEVLYRTESQYSGIQNSNDHNFEKFEDFGDFMIDYENKNSKISNDS